MTRRRYATHLARARPDSPGDAEQPTPQTPWRPPAAALRSLTGRVPGPWGPSLSRRCILIGGSFIWDAPTLRPPLPLPVVPTITGRTPAHRPAGQRRKSGVGLR